MHFSLAAKAAALSALISSVSAHSWVEYAYKLAPNGTMVGDVGYARGFVPRNSVDPPYEDKIPVNILPVSGQSAYSGDEILNKFKYEAKPKFPMLVAAPGDYIAIMHLENGHTTLPQNQPKKPLNRGTLYFYGTKHPKENEKLFDVHLLWNRDGTGGDKRGRLLATRNYDDGQCYQPNPSELSTGRAAELAHLGAQHSLELACQSDLKLPEDLKAGDVYTIYWYWDWPDLDAEKIDMEATKNGLFPWAGTFMRGQEDPNGFSADAILRNESYSSVLDIKIVEKSAASFTVSSTTDTSGDGDKKGKNKGVKPEWIADQNIYSMGIKAQMENNFQVDVDGTKKAPCTSGTPMTTSEPAVTAPADGAEDGGDNDGVATVTVTKTVAPPVSVTTVFVTLPAEETDKPVQSTSESTTTVTKTLYKTRSHSPPASESTSTTTVVKTVSVSKPAEQATESPASTPSTSTSTSTVIKTVTTIVPNKPTTSSEPEQPSYPGGQFRETPITEEPSATRTGGAPTPSPFMRKRNNWAFGTY